MEGMAAQHRARSQQRALPAAPQPCQRELRLSRQEAQPVSLRRHRSLLLGPRLLAPLLTARHLHRPQTLPAFLQLRQPAL